MSHTHTRDTIRRPGRRPRLDNPGNLPVFDAGQIFAGGRDPDRERKHASLSDTVDSMARALCRLSNGNLDGVMEDDLRREGFSLAQIAACFDEAADIARRTAVRRVHSARQG